MGEILVKFSPLANNHVVELLESEGAEAVMPDLMDFLLYSFYNSNFKAEHLGTKRSTARLCNAGIALLEYFRKAAKKELAASCHFAPPSAINELAQMAKGFVSLGNQTGEGWFLTGEDAGASPQRRQQHYLHPALWLSPQPHCGKGCHQGAEAQLSSVQYHCCRLRSWRQRSQPAKQDQAYAGHRAEESVLIIPKLFHAAASPSNQGMGLRFPADKACQGGNIKRLFFSTKFDIAPPPRFLSGSRRFSAMRSLPAMQLLPATLSYQHFPSVLHSLLQRP